MEENKKDSEKIVNTEELKKETVDTVNQVKDTIKNVDIKNDAKEATGFVSAMFKDPFAKIKEIASDDKNKNLKIAIIFLVMWMVASFVAALLTEVSFKYFSANTIFSRLWTIVRMTIAPAVSILVLSVIIFIMNKKEKKSLLTTITSITIANIPRAIGQIISLVTLLSATAYSITSEISGLCYIVSVILTYFTMKSLFNEEQNSKFIKTFVIVEAIFALVSIVFSLILGMRL